VDLSGSSLREGEGTCEHSKNIFQVPQKKGKKKKERKKESW
jgi:hypothetical protein